ncbi:hypothetical protein ACIQBJ_08650 [Kitasatospora sp. NPDC088391]|uniref:hypothetical protein n=1 Tax=Kitasatospora sp. NPDC088391 TaxID=3364074 RepID=UPI0038274211
MQWYQDVDGPVTEPGGLVAELAAFAHGATDRSAPALLWSEQEPEDGTDPPDALAGALRRALRRTVLVVADGPAGHWRRHPAAVLLVQRRGATEVTLGPPPGAAGRRTALRLRAAACLLVPAGWSYRLDPRGTAQPVALALLRPLADPVHPMHLVRPVPRGRAAEAPGACHGDT